MNAESESTEIPILLIYNLDRLHWDQFEIGFTLDKIDILDSGLKALGYPLTILPVYDKNLASILKPFSPEEYVVFNLCEELPEIPHSAGLVGEILEDMGFTHTGTEARILTFSQDKVKVKQLLDQHHIPTPGWHVYPTIHENGWHRFPAIVKPSLEHCSIGIDLESVVFNHEQLTRRIEYVINSFNHPALVEDFIDGREFRVSVIGNGDQARMLPPGEMDFSHTTHISERLLSYDSKMNPNSKYFNEIKPKMNPVLEPEEYNQMEKVALKLFNVLECRDYAGFDFRLRGGIFYVLDANADPEFSPDNSLALGAKLQGLSFPQLASFIVKEAARRHPIFKNLFTQ